MAENKSIFSNDHPFKIIFMAVALCLVGSVLVSAAAIGLRPLQEANAKLSKQTNILQVAGLYEDGTDVGAVYAERIEPRVVDLRTGEFTDAVDPEIYDERIAERDPELSAPLTAEEDPAQIKQRVHYSTIYLVKDAADDGYETIILPVHGYGLWSTLYGFVALKPDGNEVVGLQFYQHAETPGLGGEVDNPSWRAQWPGKKLYGEDGEVAIEIVKSGASGAFEVDGLAGATLTSRGVHNLVRYWVGEDGFGPFLKNMTEELANNG
ncbi:MAG: Na(+)-translocating NADH-quinone reductase subunit C [Sedimentitalea sp.]|uniref:Na(+)-translocating NADH-quinone reductase subunit C n=1 Tax=Sedimentitalea sp. TaxID=2048915 RepID=UPI00326578B3